MESSCSVTPHTAAARLRGSFAFGLFVLLSGASGLAFRTADVAWISAVGAIFQGVTSWILIPALGLAGAGVASFVGYAIGLALLAARVHLKVTVSMRVLFTAGVIAIAVLVAALRSSFCSYFRSPL